MLLASSYPLLDAFWTILEIFLFGLWIWLAISVYIDIFRSHDLSGLAKAMWVLFILVLPYAGVLVYLIFRGGEMHERAARAAQRGSIDRRWHEGPGPVSTADELNKLADLRDRGLLSQEEFDQERSKLLNRSH